MKPAIFSDKDGILNEVILRGSDISSPRAFSEFRLMEGTRELVSAARDCNFLTVVATNQPDVTLGRMQREVLDRILHEISSLGFNRLVELGEIEGRVLYVAVPNVGELALGIDRKDNRCWMEEAKGGGARFISFDASGEPDTKVPRPRHLIKVGEILRAIEATAGGANSCA